MAVRGSLLSPVLDSRPQQLPHAGSVRKGAGRVGQQAFEGRYSPGPHVGIIILTACMQERVGGEQLQ